ncbi:hypothetical protein BS78_K134300 [Paspalum vaginatum]|uniref:Uncharacterized protein n=1 Tax=Paspalum vaginatum TaxID=158149 RepID=A0A9W7X7N6_9POAL|nr:hypothetical protein BS78_K134300 [Paspalum vaginatum]
MEWASAAYTAAALVCAAAACVIALYAVMSFLSLILPENAIYFNSIREIYDAWVIYNFLSLCLAWVGGPGAVVVSLSGRMLKPSWILMTCCYPAIPLDGMQRATSPYNPVPKFIMIKSVVFLTYWQVLSSQLAWNKNTLLLGVLVFLAAKSRFIKNADKAADLQNFVLCVEMLIAAEYAGPNARPSGGFRESLLHALKFNDFYHDTVHQFAPTYNEYVLYNHNEGDNAQRSIPAGSTAPSGQGVELAGITVVASNSPVTSSASSNQADQEETMTTPIKDKVDPPGGLYDLTELLDVDLSSYPAKVPAITGVRKQ